MQYRLFAALLLAACSAHTTTPATLAPMKTSTATAISPPSGDAFVSVPPPDYTIEPVAAGALLVYHNVVGDSYAVVSGSLTDYASLLNSYTAAAKAKRVTAITAPGNITIPLASFPLGAWSVVIRNHYAPAGITSFQSIHNP